MLVLPYQAPGMPGGYLRIVSDIHQILRFKMWQPHSSMHVQNGQIIQ